VKSQFCVSSFFLEIFNPVIEVILATYGFVLNLSFSLLQCGDHRFREQLHYYKSVESQRCIQKLTTRKTTTS